MHIFGCKFSLRTDTGDTIPDRKNFDSLLWAIVTVFQVSIRPYVTGDAVSPRIASLGESREAWGLTGRSLNSDLVGRFGGAARQA